MAPTKGNIFIPPWSVKGDLSIFDSPFLTTTFICGYCIPGHHRSQSGEPPHLQLLPSHHQDTALGNTFYHLTRGPYLYQLTMGPYLYHLIMGPYLYHLTMGPYLYHLIKGPYLYHLTMGAYLYHLGPYFYHLTMGP